MNYLRDNSVVDQIYTDFYDYEFKNKLKKDYSGVDVLKYKLFWYQQVITLGRQALIIDQ